MFGGLLADGQFLGDLVSLSQWLRALHHDLHALRWESGVILPTVRRITFTQRRLYLLYTLISCLRLVHRWKGSCQSLRRLFSVWSGNLHVHNNSSTLW
jgi:hypothetical protein